MEKSDDARELLRVLDELLGDPSKLTRQQIEDWRDGVRADKILANMQQTGESYSVENLRKEFGLS